MLAGALLLIGYTLARPGPALIGLIGLLLAFAEKTAVLEPGLTWVPLTFWGLTLREAGEPGPYRLSSIALSNVASR